MTKSPGSNLYEPGPVTDTKGDKREMGPSRLLRPEHLSDFSFLLHLGGDDLAIVLCRRESAPGHVFVLFECPAWPEALLVDLDNLTELTEALNCIHLQTLLATVYEAVNAHRESLGLAPLPRPTHAATETRQ